MEIFVGISGIVVLLILIAVGVHIGFALGAVGIVGYIVLVQTKAAVMQAGMVSWAYSTSHTLVAVPLFIVMGLAVYHSGFAREVYSAAYKWFGWLPGGLGLATTFACAGFGAACGSSVATVAAMGNISLPEMERYNYDRAFSAAVLASSGTLAILIPPALGAIYYAMFTETSIGELFMAGIIPGILSAVIYAIMILILAKMRPNIGPAGPQFPLSEKIGALVPNWPIALLFVLVLGGIYGGVFTPEEAAGVGSFFAAAIGFAMGKLKKRAFYEALIETGKTSAMVFTIIIGAIIFQRFLVLTGITEATCTFIVNLGLNQYQYLAVVTVLYIILGCMLDLIGMLALTMPFVFPAALELGIDPVWFGIIVIKTMEVALITPPVGLNFFVMKSLVPEVTTISLAGKVGWFLAMDIITIIVLILFPDLTLWLPSMMTGK